MPKLIATLHTILWAAFWAFGFLAITTPAGDAGLLVGLTLTAAMCGGAGLWTWFALVRHSEATGYARPRNRAVLTEDFIA